MKLVKLMIGVVVVLTLLGGAELLATLLGYGI